MNDEGCVYTLVPVPDDKPVMESRWVDGTARLIIWRPEMLATPTEIAFTGHSFLLRCVPGWEPIFAEEAGT